MLIRRRREIPHCADSVRNDVSLRVLHSGEEDLGFGFYYEEGGGIGVAGVAEILDGGFEGGSLGGEDYVAVLAAYEIVAGFLVDELELGSHFIGIALGAAAKRRPPRKAAATFGEERV